MSGRRTVATANPEAPSSAEERKTAGFEPISLSEDVYKEFRIERITPGTQLTNDNCDYWKIPDGRIAYRKRPY